MEPVGWISQILSCFSKPFQWWVVIAPWEAGIRVRLGKTAVPLGPGIHLRIPWLDRVYIQSTRLRFLSETGQTITTADGKVLTLAVNVQYAVADVQKMFLTISDPEMVLLGKVAGVVAEFISTRPATAISPSKIEQHASAEVRADHWGLANVQVMVTNFAYVRTYRLISNDYRNTSMGSIDHLKPC